ncbi:MAG: shikimate kinase AroK [Pseudomonadales bacterium]|nr:shikimate kinase AroK [Pseudomonadales bacterium]
MLSPYIKQNVFLIGPMGVGKTTIGRLLAQELALTFIDSDQEIEERAGAAISWIFDVEGEAGFRDREVAMIDELTQREDVLLATGGGAVLREENRRCLAARGVVVFLDTSLDIQLKRTAKDKKRPLLQNDDPARVLRKLKEDRDPIYQSLADIRVFVGEAGARRVVTNIIRKLEEGGYLEQLPPAE